MLSQDAEDLLDALYAQSKRSGKRPSIIEASMQYMAEWPKDRVMDAACELEQNGDFIDLQSALGYLTLTSKALKRASGRTGSSASPTPHPTTHNTLNIGTAVNTPIQLGGSHNSQSVAYELNREMLEQLVSHYRQHVDVLSLSEADRKRADAQVMTIEAQLTHDEPNPVIVREAGRSLRTVIEGAIGGAAGTALSSAPVWTALLSMFG